MTDPIVTVYGTLVQLLQAEPTLYDPTGQNHELIVPGNFISYSGKTPYPKYKTNRGEADYPELELDEGTYQDTGYTKWQTFGNSVQGGAPWKQEIVQTFQIMLTMRDYRLDSASALRFAVSLALSKGGQQLGLQPTVKRWGPIAASQPTKMFVNGEGPRRVIKISVPVVILVDGLTLQN